jgi:cation diffusion facilitator CzcD-associated flavoprotein CzcO
MTFSTQQSAFAPASMRVAIVGAGFGGLCTAIALRQAGFRDVTIYERAPRIGGTWRDNTYPGAACDVPADVYSFSFEPWPYWSRTYATQPEILAYLEHCWRKYELAPITRTGVEIVSTRFDEQARQWHLSLRAGGTIYTANADYLVVASGPLSRPALPRFEAQDSYTGTLLHSARWDATAPLDGKRVAVIGTGASAVQLIPPLARRAAHLTVFQRTPAWVLPRLDTPRTWQRTLYRRAPAAQRLARWVARWRLEARAVAFVSRPALMAQPMRAIKGYLARAIADDALRARLTPDYVMGCKRVLLSSDYYRSLARDNVTVVAGEVRCLAPSGVVAADGGVHAADTIVCATGFETLGSGAPFPIHGRNGLSLDARWNGTGPRAYLGAAVAGFPNMFMLLGPNTGLGHSSVTLIMEAQVRHVVKCLRWARRHGARQVEVREQTERSYDARVQAALAGTVWTTGCRSWYQDARGRNTAIWPDYTFRFSAAARFDPRAYDFSV